jgi:hypothetical protein
MVACPARDAWGRAIVDVADYLYQFSFVYGHAGRSDAIICRQWEPT